MRVWLGRLWCRCFHRDLWKTEHVVDVFYRKRCLECGNIFLFTEEGATKQPDL